MVLPDFNNWINNSWQRPEYALEQSLTNASSGVEIGQPLSSSKEQIEQAIVVANRSFENGVWSELSNQVRSQYLLQVADRLDQQLAAIAAVDTVQTGVNIKLTTAFAQVCSQAFRISANILSTSSNQTWLATQDKKVLVERFPLGVAAIIAPWNAPAGIACHKLASALAAGCSVIFKPSEWAAGSAQYIAQALAQAELPAGVFQMLHGDAGVGAQIVDDHRVNCVSFTGGALAGAAVGKSCGQNIKPMQLELGGNNPMIVFAGADLDAAADAVVAGLVTMNAQWCRALGRLLIQESIQAELLAKVRERLAKVVMGDASDPEVQMGPMIHKGHLQHLQARINHYQALGARIEQITPLPDLNGWFLAPTLVHDLDPSLTLEETFGPVACVHTFKDETEAKMLANQTVYGLAAYIFAETDFAWQFARKVRAGVIKINKLSLFGLSPDAPRPAWGKSGVADEGNMATFEFFRGSKVIGEPA
ncbi:aldehyde dehydrogenase [Paraferrimonas sp. SM1919]|uniref:aldehyde dehydrogenase family protein n=1 Tax=Paraferrimonas sp. SM1919 TaxID=2662263 RepID=UPI0013D42BEF|nr:aldehyde dehydrogenase family protein [Paraferrimonas sp. SM1919]